jgi:hypothetical protein
MDHPLEFGAVEELIHSFWICQRGTNKLEAPVLLEQGQARLLEAHIVILVYRVETDDVVSISKKPIGDVKANETRCTSYKDPHALPGQRVGVVANLRRDNTRLRKLGNR